MIQELTNVVIDDTNASAGYTLQSILGYPYVNHGDCPEGIRKFLNRNPHFELSLSRKLESMFVSQDNKTAALELLLLHSIPQACKCLFSYWVPFSEANSMLSSFNIVTNQVGRLAEYLRDIGNACFSDYTSGDLALSLQILVKLVDIAVLFMTYDDAVDNKTLPESSHSFIKASERLVNFTVNLFSVVMQFSKSL